MLSATQRASVGERLKAQNGIALWIDCSQRGRRHRWFLRHVVRDHVYWGCKRCPVDVMTLGEVPAR